MRRPPVRQSTMVRSGIDHTFDTFVRRIGEWWPLVPYSRGKDRVRSVNFERQGGGRVYEVWDDGTEKDWEEILSWNPPSGFAMTWRVTPTPTEVEFSFQVLGPSLTRVSVEHRGWEALTEEQLVEACALPGGYQGGAFDRGWAHILACMAGQAERSVSNI